MFSALHKTHIKGKEKPGVLKVMGELSYSLVQISTLSPRSQHIVLGADLLAWTPHGNKLPSQKSTALLFPLPEETVTLSLLNSLLSPLKAI